jgi:hypothetical protein
VAIYGPNPRVSELDTVGNRVRLVLGTIWAFCATKKELVRETIMRSFMERIIYIGALNKTFKE